MKKLMLMTGITVVLDNLVTFWITGERFFWNLYLALPLNFEGRRFWFTENFWTILLSGLFTLAWIYLVLGYRFKKSELFMVNKLTLICGIVELGILTIGFLIEFNKHYYPIPLYLGEALKQLFGVAVTEELIFRGYVSNCFFPYVKNGRTLLAVAGFSALLFALTHIPFYLYNLPPGTAIPWGELLYSRFAYPFYVGFIFTLLLYFKKDIILLILLHAGGNLISSLLTGSVATLCLLIHNILFLFLIYNIFRNNHIFSQFSKEKTISENGLK